MAERGLGKLIWQPILYCTLTWTLVWKDQLPYKYKRLWPIDNTQSNLPIHLLFIFYLIFPIYYFFSFFVVDDVHCFNDDKALERSGWLGQSIAAARPDRVPPGRVGFRVSRDLAGESCVSRSWQGSSGDVSCVSHSSPGAYGDVFVCKH
jgi:hypothetical protein